VANAEGVVFTFAALRESTQATVLAVGVKPVAASGQNFVTVSLVADVPNQLVFRCIERVVQCHRQFYYAQASSEVPSLFRNDVDNEVAQFITNRW